MPEYSNGWQFGTVYYNFNSIGLFAFKSLRNGTPSALRSRSGLPRAPFKFPLPGPSRRKPRAKTPGMASLLPVTFFFFHFFFTFKKLNSALLLVGGVLEFFLLTFIFYFSLV
jgi:hypothetical protein